jgi:N-hydroxyarylamine O-acetyltransferase
LDAVDAQLQGSKAYRILRKDGYHILQDRSGTGRWNDSYRFTLTPRQLGDFEGMCRHHQISPESHFTRNRLCSLATPSGRKTLSGGRLIHTSRDGKRRERAIAHEGEYRRLLRDLFGVRLPKQATFRAAAG